MDGDAWTDLLGPHWSRGPLSPLEELVRLESELENVRAANRLRAERVRDLAAEILRGERREAELELLVREARTRGKC